jgi:hypothetical protein
MGTEERYPKKSRLWGTSILEFEGRTLFKAAPFFQEGIPLFADLKVEGSILSWTDGEYDYQLNIQKNEPNKAMQPTPVDVTPRADARAAPSTSVADLGRSAK